MRDGTEAGKFRKVRDTLGAVGWLAHQDGIAQAGTLRFQVIEKTASPNEFSRENAERENHRKQAWAGSNKHDDSNNEQGEPEDNFQEPFRLLQRLY